MSKSHKLSLTEIVLISLITAIFVIFFYVIGIPLLFWLCLIALYFIPSIIAYNRNHPYKMAILALNVLLGWTFVGWVVSFVWSLSGTNWGFTITQTGASAADELERLAELKEKGIITDKEFKQKKQEILKL